MCLAIATNSQKSNSLFARSWSHIASTPFKLLSFGAIIHLLIGACIILYSSYADTHININTLISGLLFGVVPLFVFGYLLTWLPRKYSLSPVHYGRYNSIYLLAMTALFLLELGSVFDNHWTPTGMLLLTPAWIIALQSLSDMHGWMRSNIQKISRPLLILLYINLAILVISVLDLIAGTLLYDGVSQISILIIWPPVLVLSALLVIRAPAKSRIISF